MENIHLRFKEVRQNQGLTQAEIADKLGMKQSAWARLENGGVPDPRSSTISDICRTFDIDANWLLGLNIDVQKKITVYDLLGDKPILTAKPLNGQKKNTG